MQIQNENSADNSYDLKNITDPPANKEFQQLIQTTKFERKRWNLCDLTTIVSDRFPDIGEASCSFFRMDSPLDQTVRFTVEDICQVKSCPSGGWLLIPSKATSPSYWIPQNLVLRTLDDHSRILSETPTAIVGIEVISSKLIFEIQTSKDTLLDLTIWRFVPGQSNLQEELEHLLVLEKQSIFCWNSQSTYNIPADVYSYLIHGHVYTDRFIWPRMWKICSELDAYSLFLTMKGLELATNKKLYSLLKIQIVYSVITRQAQDGGWYHGEWTDYMESHYRFHNGALLLLGAALEEWDDEIIHRSFEQGALFISRQTDMTKIGLWFLHDSLEKSAEMMDELCKQTGSRWIPSRILGKSPTNKLILNTHLDSIAALCRYQEVTGDHRYAEKISSALSAAKNILSLRPAEMLYRFTYRLINLTLLPASEAKRLPLITRAIKRLTWKYVSPNFYILKRLYPRIVMPGGLIERHLSMPHCDFNYPAVNIMDLTRLWRYFPEKDLSEVLNNAINAVTSSSIIKYWGESKPGNPQQFALIVWIEALYNMCILSRKTAYRRHLAEAILCAEDNALGLPPVLIGCNPEISKSNIERPCLSPTDTRLRVANLSCDDHSEMLVVNSSTKDIKLEWEQNSIYDLSWTSPNGPFISKDSNKLSVPSRGWLLGIETDQLDKESKNN